MQEYMAKMNTDFLLKGAGIPDPSEPIEIDLFELRKGIYAAFDQASKSCLISL